MENQLNMKISEGNTTYLIPFHVNGHLTPLPNSARVFISLCVLCVYVVNRRRLPASVYAYGSTTHVYMYHISSYLDEILILVTTFLKKYIHS